MKSTIQEIHPQKNTTSDQFPKATQVTIEHRAPFENAKDSFPIKHNFGFEWLFRLSVPMLGKGNCRDLKLFSLYPAFKICYNIIFMYC